MLRVSRLAARITCVCVLVLVCSFVVHAQVFRVMGGASSLYSADGGTVEMRSGNLAASFSAGVVDGRFGIGTQVCEWRGPYQFTAGDDTYRLSLPTDVFDNSPYFLVRGIGVGWTNTKTQITTFAGASALGSGAPFFASAHAQEAMGLVFVQRSLTPTMRVFSRNVAGSRVTSISGLEWQPMKAIRNSVAAGVGSGQRYFATSSDIRTDKLSVQGEFVNAGDRFRRLGVLPPTNAETDGVSILGTYRPNPSFAVTAGHQNFMQAAGPEAQSFAKVSVNQFQAAAQVFTVRLGGGVFASKYAAQHSFGDTLFAARKLWRLDLGVNYFSSRGSGGHSQILSGSVRERISAKVDLLQVLNLTGGRTSVSFGGHYRRNRMSFGLDYQTLYIPTLAQPFKQTMGITVQVQPFGAVQVNAQTYVTSEGRMRYTASAGSYFYGQQPGPLPQGASFRMPKYIVRGRVVDEHGDGVSGAAIEVGDHVVLTDDSGRFFLRVAHEQRYALQVLLEQFVNPKVYQVAFCPPEVESVRDEEPGEVLIVLATPGARPVGVTQPKL